MLTCFFFNLRSLKLWLTTTSAPKKTLEVTFTMWFTPLGIAKYQVKHPHAATDDGEPIITSLIMSAIECEAFTRGSVGTPFFCFVSHFSIIQG